jgi:hypothetical protein
VSSPVQSASTSLFRDSAEQLALRLEQETTENARTMAREARELVAIFTGWQAARPPDDVRLSTIQRLFALNRQAMDMLTR